MHRKKIDAILEVTKRCNLRCRTCFAWRFPRESDELTIEEWKKVVNSLPRTSDHDVSVILGGGEPLLKEGVLEIVTVCSKNGYETGLSTSGFGIDRKMARDIVDSGLSNLFLSLNSLDEEIHDFLKGIPGLYNKLMKAIDYIVEYRKNEKPRIMISSLITDKNLHGLADLAKRVSADNRLSGIGFQAIVTPFYSDEDETWYIKEKYKDLWPQDKVRVKNVIDELIKLKEAGHKILTPIAQFRTFIDYYSNPQRFVRKGECHLGYRNFSIGSDGYVFLCFLMEPIDNIRRHSFEEIWNSDRANQFRQIIKKCKKNCQILVNCWFDEE